MENITVSFNDELENFIPKNGVFKRVDKKQFFNNLENRNAVVPPPPGNEEIMEENPQNNLALYIAIPLAAVVLILLLTATAQIRYKKLRLRHTGQKHRTNSINNNNHIESGEELQPLKRNSRQDYTENTPSGGMQIITESSPQKIKRLSNDCTTIKFLIEGQKSTENKVSPVENIESKEDVGESLNRLSSTSSESKVTVSCIDTSTGSTSKSSLHEKEVALPGCVLHSNPTNENIKKLPIATIPLERPNTLSVMTVIGDTSNSCSATPSKGFPWAEQLWTPDADVIHETVSPCIDINSEEETLDKITPLMARNKFRMKPKGLLERRGSNVALTISLSAEEKDKPTPPPSLIKSPKPLVYLRTASNELDMNQLHAKAVDTQRLQHEYWEIPMNHPSEKHFSIPGYGTKNRYRSILPNPHSRVLLPATPSGDPLSMYINANYIRGYNAIKSSRKMSESDKENTMKRRMSAKRKAAFIATQGPLTNTISDFWKMVWRERSNTIIMITKLKELKEKCSAYIPKEIGESETYEDFIVTVNHVRKANHYDVRTITLSNTATNESRTVSHFWYPEWLDHETPEKTRSVLELIQEVAVLCPDDNEHSEFGPVVVHCSAGIGRTGCFIAIAIGSTMLQQESKVDILKIVCHMRMDRGGMIQTWEQYQYVHLALSRYARVLNGENVTTPSTAGSITSPPTTHQSPQEVIVVTNGNSNKQDIRDINTAQVKRRNFSNNSLKTDHVGLCSPICESPHIKEDDLSGSYSPGKRVKTNENVFFSSDKEPKNKNLILPNELGDENNEESQLTNNTNKTKPKFSSDKFKFSKLEHNSPKTPISSPPFRDTTNSESPAIKSPKSAQLPHVFTFPSPANH